MKVYIEMSGVRSREIAKGPGFDDYLTLTPVFADKIVFRRLRPVHSGRPREVVDWPSAMQFYELHKKVAS